MKRGKRFGSDLFFLFDYLANNNSLRPVPPDVPSGMLKLSRIWDDILPFIAFVNPYNFSNVVRENYT